MPLAVIIIKVIAKCFIVAIWTLGAAYGVKMFQKIMKGAVADFKENPSKENRLDIIGAYCVFALAAIVMVAILITSVIF